MASPRPVWAKQQDSALKRWGALDFVCGSKMELLPTCPIHATPWFDPKHEGWGMGNGMRRDREKTENHF